MARLCPFGETIALPNIELIDTPAALDLLCDSLGKAELVALDTEFVRESTYFAELCLIQLATDKHVACIDCRAGLELGPLFERIFDPRTRLLAHSGRQDLEVLQQASGELPARLLDTQIAAALLGHPQQIGLRELLLERLNIEIEKSLARTDWRKRPLGASAVQYAADDVLYLRPLWQSLAEELTLRGRMDWFEEDCARALSVELEPGLVTLYQRARGTGRLRGRQINAALALLEWREDRARAANRPRRWILADDVLVELAKSMPADPEDLGRVGALSPKMRARHAAALLSAIAKADAARYSQLAKQCMPAPRPDARELRELQGRVQAVAKDLGIEPEIIATRRDLAAIVNGEPPQHIRAGWRHATLALAA
jgi:ribonuclease D